MRMNIMATAALALIIALITPTSTRAQEASPPIGDWKCPEGWAKYEGIFSKHYKPYLQCDYTTETCERGYQSDSPYSPGTSRLFELLAKDRTTVIGHFMCSIDVWRGASSETCMNFESGVRTVNGRQIPIMTDQCYGEQVKPAPKPDTTPWPDNPLSKPEE